MEAQPQKLKLAQLEKHEADRHRLDRRGLFLVRIHILLPVNLSKECEISMQMAIPSDGIDRATPARLIATLRFRLAGCLAMDEAFTWLVRHVESV